jgi:RHS repeat-associated protein
LLAAQGTRPSALQYTGEQNDLDTGLIYLRARWYDPATGRFTTRDPFPGFVALPQTLHPYVYVNNNPVNLTDPSGKIAPVIIAIALGMLIGGGAGGIIFAITNPCTDLLRSPDFWQSILVGAISGGVAGLVSWLVPLLLPTASGFWSATGVGMITGSAAGGAGQATANLLNGKPLHQDMLQAMLLGGALGGLAGSVSWKIREWVNIAARLREAARQADNAIPGQGGAVGTQKHTVFQGIVDSWNNSRLRTEVSYLLGREVPRGTRGSVRLDVVQFDDGGNVVAVFDYKSGTAVLDAARIAQIRSQLPANAQNVPIIEIKGH